MGSIFAVQVELAAVGSSKLPKKVLGMYILLADDTEDGFHDDDDWDPALYSYQQEGSNVLFFTFINPENMTVPLAFKKLAATRGTDVEGAVPADTLIIFAVGGYAYSLEPNPWPFLTSQQNAEAMAVEVAKWKDEYGIDGIDLDIEEGGGDSSNGLADSIGIMVYDGAQSLDYVENYAVGDQWGPIKCDVPKPQIMVGAMGSASAASVDKLAKESVKQDLLGVMVWYCSVKNGPVYEFDWDCTNYQESMDAYVAAMKYFNGHM